MTEDIMDISAQINFLFTPIQFFIYSIEIEILATNLLKFSIDTNDKST